MHIHIYIYIYILEHIPAAPVEQACHPSPLPVNALRGFRTHPAGCLSGGSFAGVPLKIYQ